MLSIHPSQVKHKSTFIEKMLNPIISITLLIQGVLCMIMSIFGAQFQVREEGLSACLRAIS